MINQRCWNNYFLVQSLVWAVEHLPMGKTCSHITSLQLFLFGSALQSAVYSIQNMISKSIVNNKIISFIIFIFIIRSTIIISTIIVIIVIMMSRVIRYYAIGVYKGNYSPFLIFTNWVIEDRPICVCYMNGSDAVSRVMIRTFVGRYR